MQGASSAERVHQYARDVVEGRIVAGEPVIHACRRHLRDLETGHERGLSFDAARASDALDFFPEVLRLSGGQHEGMPFDLDDWQAFVIGSLFGWLRADGSRRFRSAYVETAKGSGKSPMAGGIGLYLLVADGEPRAEIYAAATKLDQAKILFADAVAMVRHSPGLLENVSISGTLGRETNLAYLKQMSFFRPISSEDSQSGPRPHGALVDEVHEHKDGTVIDMLDAGKKSRRQPLIFMITNAGADPTSVCGTYHDYAKQVASGQLEDDTFFGYVCALDKGDDPFKDEDCWLKTNPSLGIGLPGYDYLRERVRKARGMPSQESRVMRLNFCKWTQAVSPWLSPDEWLQASDAEFDADRLLGRSCFGGLDMASTTDLASLALLFEPVPEDPHWRQLTWFWTPGDRLDEREKEDKVPYRYWRDAGYLEAVPGKAIDKRVVANRILEIARLYDLMRLHYDRARIEDLLMLLSDDDEAADLPLEPFGQGFLSMAPAVDEYERMLLSGELRHDGNPVMTWCAANAVVVMDDAGNRKLTKRRSRGRIDGAVAAVMAAGCAVREGESNEAEQAFVAL